MILALIGNQNCGKTTLFNVLTGSNQHVGNFPGVTVDQKTGTVKGFKDVSVVDLPGIYSIRPYSTEEIVTTDFIFNARPDGIINIVDATNIERNLYLTLQLIELRIPMVIALNMMDEVRENGGSFDIEKFSELLGVPVVPVSAAKGEGIDELIKTVVDTSKKKIEPKRIDFCPAGPVHRCIHAVSHEIEDHATEMNVSPRYAAIKAIDGDDIEFIKSLNLSLNELELIEHSVVEMEKERGLDRNAALADMRYAFISEVCEQSVVKCKESREKIRSDKIDRFLTNRYGAIPLFCLIMISVFYLTFNCFGKALSDLLTFGIDGVTSLADKALTAYGINPIVHSLVIDGVFAGVGSVLSFLPVIVVLFFFLSVLEDTGYMARVAFVMDKLLRKIGLSGRSFVPMIIGFGCSVPAIMASRTLSSERDRKMTVLLTPFMSCSAKIPIYTVFAAAFFPKNTALVMGALYFGGMLTGILVSLIMNKTVFKGKPVPFVMELPNYRFPSPKSVLLLMWEKAKDFLQKAFTVIFAATVIIWFLGAFDTRLNYVSNSEQSILASVGKLIAPVFTPMGFGDWRTATSLIAGFSAKEAVVSTLGVLLNVKNGELASVLPGVFSTASACAFLAFTLLYTPCIAAVTTIKKELGSRLKACLVVISQCVIAWLASYLVFSIASVF